MSIKPRTPLLMRVDSVEMSFEQAVMFDKALHLLSHLMDHGFIVFDDGSLTSMLADLIHGRGLLSAVVAAGERREADALHV